MVDKYKGIVEIEIAGSKRGFKFGAHAMIIFCDLEKIEPEQYEESLKKPSYKTQLNYYLSGAIAYCKLYKQDEPTLAEVCAWIDEVSMAKMEIEAAKSVGIPNEPTP